MRPSVSTTESRLGAVLMIVSRKRYCARTSACSRSFSNASEAVAATASTSSRWSVEAPVVDQRRDALAAVLDERRGVRALARSARRAPVPRRRPTPARCADQYARSSDGSPSASASASRSGVPLPSAITRSAMPARASRLRRMPARNAIGISARGAERDELEHDRRAAAERRDDAARDERRERLEREEVDGADDPPQRRASRAR